MDDYADYCYGSLVDIPEGIVFLENLGIFSKEDILNLKPVSGVETKKNNTKKSNRIVACKFCKSSDIIERSIQTRSLDEGETLYIICKSCKKTYS